MGLGLGLVLGFSWDADPGEGEINQCQGKKRLKFR
jgi:hypothetical protein